MLSARIIIGLLLGSPTLAQRWEPFPVCLSCMPQALLDAPGVGFDLSDSYGTVAVKFQNGTAVNVAKIEGDEEYRSLMTRLSGREAQSSKFIHRLRQSASHHLNATVDLALATHPSLPLLDLDFLSRAFEMAGICHLRSYKALHRLDSMHHVLSGVAGLGLGICTQWRDSRACEEEDLNMSWKQTLGIEFTNEVLIVSNTLVVGPHRFEEVEERVHVDLGFKNRRKDTGFWVKVRKAIGAVPVSVRTPDLLLIFGDAASDGKFLEVVKLAFHNMELDYLFEDWESNIAAHNALYTAARGAAEIASVWQGSEWNCLERESCEGSRPENDGEGVTLKEMFERRARWNESCVIGECNW